MHDKHAYKFHTKHVYRFHNYNYGDSATRELTSRQIYWRLQESLSSVLPIQEIIPSANISESNTNISDGWEDKYYAEYLKDLHS
jgi:hypothetical protein